MPAVSRETPFRLNRSQLLLQRLYIRSHEDKRDVQLFPQYGWETAWNGFIDCKSTSVYVCHSARKLILRAFPRPPCYGWYQDRTVWSWATDDLADRSSRLLESWMPNRISWILYEPCLNFQFLYSFHFHIVESIACLTQYIQGWIYITVKPGMLMRLVSWISDVWTTRAPLVWELSVRTGLIACFKYYACS